MVREIELKNEYNDITKYIGIIDARDGIVESYKVENGFIVLTETRLVNIEKSAIKWEIELNDIEDFRLGLRKNFQLTLVDVKRKVNLNFSERKRSLRFYKNILKKIA